MKSEFLQVAKIAEAVGWVHIDFQPDNYLTSFWKNNIRINVWIGKRGITVGVQRQINGQTTHKYTRRADINIVKRIFSTTV